MNTDTQYQPINTALDPELLSEKETKLYWVVGNDALGSGGFYWTPIENEKEAREAFEREKANWADADAQNHFFVYEAEADITREALEEEIDSFYADMSRTHDFNSNPNVVCYPFSADKWMRIVKQHNEWLG